MYKINDKRIMQNDLLILLKKCFKKNFFFQGISKEFIKKNFKLMISIYLFTKKRFKFILLPFTKNE